MTNDPRVEAAARAMQRCFEETGDDPADIRPWDDDELSDEDRDAWRGAARAALAAADAVVARPKITHGRHCLCTPCAREDWTNPELAPCGMHGSSCPPVYAPLGAAGDPVPAADAVPAGAGEAEPQKWTGAEILRTGRPVGEAVNPYRDRTDRNGERLADAWDEGFRAAAGAAEELAAAARLDERERLSARVAENGWCPTCGRAGGGES